MATLLAYGGLVIFGLPRARRVLDFDPQWTILGKSLLACVPMSLFLWWVRPVGIWGLAGSVIGGALLYVVGLLLLRVIQPEEIRLVRSLLRVRPAPAERGSH